MIARVQSNPYASIPVYDNFVFHVEVRFPRNGNSGVLIHVQRDDVWPKGIECQHYQGTWAGSPAEELGLGARDTIVFL
jgi:hypothetical protein